MYKDGITVAGEDHTSLGDVISGIPEFAEAFPSLEYDQVTRMQPVAELPLF